MGLRRTLLCFAVPLVAWALTGCGTKPGPAPAPDPVSGTAEAEPAGDPVSEGVEQTAKTSPDDALYEQLRSGGVQLQAAAASIQEALVKAKGMESQATGEWKAALEDIVALLDSAGMTVTDAVGASPTRDEVKGAFSQFDDRRLKAIEAANDANKDLGDAAGLAASLSESEPKYEDLANLIDVAAGDVRDAITALGGTVVAAPDLGEQPTEPAPPAP